MTRDKQTVRKSASEETPRKQLATNAKQKCAFVICSVINSRPYRPVKVVLRKIRLYQNVSNY